MMLDPKSIVFIISNIQEDIIAKPLTILVSVMQDLLLFVDDGIRIFGTADLPNTDVFPIIPILPIEPPLIDFLAFKYFDLYFKYFF